MTLDEVIDRSIRNFLNGNSKDLKVSGELAAGKFLFDTDFFDKMEKELLASKPKRKKKEEEDDEDEEGMQHEASEADEEEVTEDESEDDDPEKDTDEGGSLGTFL